MTWQDTVISISNIVASISLVFQVYYGFKEKVGPIKYPPSIPVFMSLFAISYSFWTLELRLSAIITFISASLWVMLFLQRVMYNKKNI
jgi:hypothetical protein